MLENIVNLQTQRWAYQVFENDPLYEESERIDQIAYQTYDPAV
jgi:hypothetical protein